jgi:predicted amidohydrolase
MNLKKLMAIAGVFLLVLSMVFKSDVYAKKEVKISVIGAAAPKLDLTQDSQVLVDEMIAFWQHELSRVLPDHPDLILLPEACDRPAGMSVEMQLKYFSVRGNQILEYFSAVAARNQCYIAFGMKHQLEDESWRNSCFIVNRKGEISGVYNKNYPTIGEMEAGIKAGRQVPVFELDFGRVACAICFDLNFEELRAQFAAQKPDLILFPSMYHGGLVQEQWAYGCRAYFAAAIGIASLPSEIRNPLGKIMATSTNYFHYTTATINLDYALVHLDYNWVKLEAMKEQYGDAVVISDPGEVGSVLLTSQHETRTILDMMGEFDIMLLDDYLERSRAFRKKEGMME